MTYIRALSQPRAHVIYKADQQIQNRPVAVIRKDICDGHLEGNDFEVERSEN